ncbi:hypothetical protein DWQ65_06610 [Treponema phagedenis]|uniref:Uncharacterized protein n=1 Tax=Treponema phagedenis TaxID=162 RepID=A0A0B7GP44_TREPH|nr:hypothetical protein HMPREF9554_01860 [Treponema phagedenis F0421]QSH93464.1 hypothetical protein C5O78_00035 [Treponema phagedenis]QSH99737.1 hypothetical protein DWQ65_06610 [Treponema phagedenis]CEM60339.1 conserved hypothetical protein [Treponema phagedenis]
MSIKKYKIFKKKLRIEESKIWAQRFYMDGVAFVINLTCYAKRSKNKNSKVSPLLKSKRCLKASAVNYKLKLLNSQH